MIKEPNFLENPKISVFLRDGRSFLNKDITSKPFGDYEQMIAFWDGDKVVGIPLALVDHYEFSFGNA